jgi:choline dehydrogenase
VDGPHFTAKRRLNGQTGFDVIVAGAGTAGCVVARRLLDAGLSVLLLEAGPDHADGIPEAAAIDDPARMHELWDTDVDWGYRTVPQRHAGGRRLHLPRGRVLGGSHALNGMIWVRGHPADYDTWAYLGNPGWSWADVEPVFARVESLQDVLIDFEPHPVHRAIVDAAVSYGIPFNPDHNSGVPDGVSYTQLTIRDGRRSTTAQTYLGPVRGHPRLSVLTRSRIHRVLVDGARCTGVEWDRGGVLERASSGHVVLASGALGSPLVLQRSGVGDPDLLRPLGIEVVSPLLGVGGNLADHWLVPVILATAIPVDAPVGLPTLQSHLFWYSRPGLSVPDLQPVHFAAPLTEPWMRAPDHGVSLMAGLIRPASRGTVRIASADPDEPPLIDPCALGAASDVDTLVAAIELCRGIAREAPLREAWGAREVHPGEDDLRDYVRRTVVTYHHQTGTCAMGSVVDPALRVHGLTGLTVADASVMPTVPTGNTNAPSAMIGERAAEFVLTGG